MGPLQARGPRSARRRRGGQRPLYAGAGAIALSRHAAPERLRPVADDGARPRRALEQGALMRSRAPKGARSRTASSSTATSLGGSMRVRVPFVGDRRWVRRAGARSACATSSYTTQEFRERTDVHRYGSIGLSFRREEDRLRRRGGGRRVKVRRRLRPGAPRAWWKFVRAAPRFATGGGVARRAHRVLALQSGTRAPRLESCRSAGGSFTSTGEGTLRDAACSRRASR